MRVSVTCGPGIAPIDQVRRITNVSTGELGVMLANAMSAAGHEVTCFRSVGVTTGRRLAEGMPVVDFATNDDLAAALGAVEADGVFHAAALGDYEVAEVRDEAGNLLTGAKIPSRAGDLMVRLKAARKVIGSLRETFPRARIVGWKYELGGGREAALERGRRQLAEARTDACVINGSAFGEGFGLLEAGGALRTFASKRALVGGLVEWLEGSQPPAGRL